ncbi:RNA cap guanine-N2 methyltransferase [Paragonimus heterotremus]|uniref:Trimethylguanosine synthase n=1 Tax=Paragonimus heterotremus TaxID=100268 RepID=A0A8J4T3Z5_9TREM|nr:RNA cap guanine-N2 methyltransferase [Paragonimus heterotremus]
MPILDTLSDVSSTGSDSDTVQLPVADHPQKVLLDLKKCVHRRRRRHRAKSNPLGDPALLKYWNRRYELFERFDQGIQLDRVVGIENNHSRMLLLQQNAKIYGVVHKVMLVCGDAPIVMRALRREPLTKVTYQPTGEQNDLTSYAPEAEETNPDSSPRCRRDRFIFDFVFMSPPWGGPGYTGVVLPPGSGSWNTRKRRQWFQSAEEAVEPTKNLEEIPLLSATLQAASHLCRRILVYLPRNASIGQIIQLGWPSTVCNCYLCSQQREVTIEEYVVRGRRIAIGVHIGAQ